MKTFTTTTVVALIGLLVISCTKKTPQKENHMPSKLWDLGAVELSNHESCTNNLGDGKDCVVTFVTTPGNNVEVDFVVEAKNSSGNKEIISQPRIITAPGRAVAISVGDIGVAITPKLKAN